MSSLADLPWLTAPPADFVEQCRALVADAGRAGLGAQAARLAVHALDGRQARRLGRAIGRIAEAGGDLAPLAPLRLVVLSNKTFDFIGDHLPAAAARHGVALDLILPPFDQAMQQALDPASQTRRAGPDAILLALDHDWYGLGAGALDDPRIALLDAMARLGDLLSALQENTAATLYLSTAATPPMSLFGSLDARAPGSPRALIEALNVAIVRMAEERGALLMDTRALAEQVGTERWFDPVQHFAYKLPFASAYGAIYADWVGRLAGAARGRARKCLVLDLDNTLWGGVVGDDGLAGLVLGPGSARGESFLAVQNMALALKARGVILAVSSKNDDAVARGAFEQHPEMALKPADIAVFQANWRDKPSNLEAIAESLNIGLDAMVLLDDNPAERAQVRAALPTVAVPELPADPAWFPWTLMSAGYFEAVGFSAEDRLRAAAYAGDAHRAEVKATARDLGDYLTSLDMRLTAGPFDPAGRTRIAQLINKTNQFNLTTRRYSEGDVAAFEADPAAITLQIRLADRFGDLGMIGVVIVRVREASDGVSEATVDSWLMSCRVLGRQVEEAMLALLLERAAAAGATRIAAQYRPTPKNGMVRNLLDRLGFALVAEDEAGVRHYVLAVGGAAEAALPMRIERAAEGASRPRPP
ncbi:MAG: HAD-IIIC family phosphatase [Pseudomonadota bacterium]|nr:HAD-IIIC family phosphatase [Pseudomonadota bacterium]